MKDVNEGVKNIDYKKSNDGLVTNERLIQVVFDPTKPVKESLSFDFKEQY